MPTRKTKTRKAKPFTAKELPGLHTVALLLTINGTPQAPRVIRASFNKKGSPITLSKDHFNKILFRLRQAGFVERRISRTKTDYVATSYCLTARGQSVAAYIRSRAA